MDKLGMDRGKDFYAQRLLNDLYRVGPDKPIGYLPLSNIANICKKDVADLENELKNRGLSTMVFKKGDCKIGSGALFAYDTHTLRQWLHTRSNVRILESYGWSGEPAEFVKSVATEIVSADHPLFDLIADCFADKENPLRSSNRRPSY